MDTFVNPIAEGADPWVVRDPYKPDRYLWCMSEGNRAICIHTSSRLTSLGQKHVVWRAPKKGPVSQQVWAPELHHLDGHWHIYFAASDGDNRNHLTYVLRSKGTDPLGEYVLHGPLKTGDGDDGKSPNIWAIDMTVMELFGKRYAVWSGWDAPGTDKQFLYIARMESATEIVPPRVRLCDNDDFMWERVKPKKRERGLNEAPQVFQNQGTTFIVYSCGGSWLKTYKLGLMELVGVNPLDPSSWNKHAMPVFQGNGVGHSCFIKSLDGEELWHVYHAKQGGKPGWRRAVYVQPMHVYERDGTPIFGTPLEAGSEIPRPSGERFPIAKLPYRQAFEDHNSLADWSYYGHHQFMSLSEKLHLGVVPREPINDYRSGEKVILDRQLPANYSIEVCIDFGGNKRADEAGLLFRCSGVSVGYNAQRGYYAGLFPQKQTMVVGKMDGKDWKELHQAPSDIAVDKPQQLCVTVSGVEFTVFHNGRRLLSVSDDSYSNGFAGLRAAHTHAKFSHFAIDLLGSDKLVL